MMVLPTTRGRVTLGEALRREQSKAMARFKRDDSPVVVRAFHEPCFKCGSAGACRHRADA